MVSPHPYLPFTLEELTSIRDPRVLDRWIHTQVRVLGHITLAQASQATCILNALAEETRSALPVDFSQVENASSLQSGAIVQILGHIECRGSSPWIQAHLVRDCSGIDAARYQAALKLQAPYCPLNVAASPALPAELDASERLEPRSPPRQWTPEPQEPGTDLNLSRDMFED